jgi:hypothetical protein
VRWEIPVATGCLESTPAAWNGRMYVGSRDGYFYAIGDRNQASAEKGLNTRSGRTTGSQ